MIDFVFFDGQLWPYDEWAKIAPLTLLCPEKEPSPNARLWDEGYSNEQQKALLYSQYKGAFFLVVRETNEVIMKHFKVCINYGRKCAAYETVVTAATEADAKHQAKVMAAMCGFDAAIKKITVQEC